MDIKFLDVIYQLLPGFFAAWVFYGLTTHPRREIFERVVQALIFTGFVKVITACFKRAMLGLGHIHSFGTWTQQIEFGWSMVFAVILGVVISYCANRDIVHRWLREGKYVKKLRITTKNSFPSEWFSAFQREERWVVLYLKDKRRLRGWPEEWPNDPTGHFLLLNAAWILKDGTAIPMTQSKRVIMDAKLVEWVEQLTNENERPLTPEQITEAQQRLIDIHKKPKPKQEVPSNGK